MLSVSQVEVEIFDRLSEQMHGRLHRVTKSYQVLTTFSHLVLLQKCQCVLNPNLILKVALDSGNFGERISQKNKLSSSKRRQ